jgi:uncharacterized protein YutE (UPF0331/DUF86 family)
MLSVFARSNSVTSEMEERLSWDEHECLYERIIPKALRYSCIVALMTAVDTALMAICEELRRRGGIKLPVSALRGSDRRKAMVYLKKVVGITPPSGWFGSRLSHLGAIRNCIVHQDGEVAATRNQRRFENTSRQCRASLSRTESSPSPRVPVENWRARQWSGGSISARRRASSG